MSQDAPASPPGGKRAVVLRAGPPKHRGRLLDGVLGVVGAVVLLVAVLLVNVLPEYEEPAPQYRVEYESVPMEIPTSIRSEDLKPDTGGILPVGGGNALDIPYELEQNNIFEVIVFVTLFDDFEESLPDEVMVELFNPSGESVAISSPQPTLPTQELDDQAKSVGNYFDTVDPHEYRVAFNLGGKPEDAIVNFEDGENVTLEEAEAAIVQRDTRPTQGTWTVRIWVEKVGGCPQVQPGTTSQPQIRHAQFCALADRESHGGNGDTGNGFILNRVEYTYYDIHVSEA